MTIRSLNLQRFARLRGFCAAVAMTVVAACSASPEPAGSVATPAANPAQVPDKSPPMDPADAVSRLVTSRNACKLLTRADAETAVGQPLPQNTVANEVQGMCDYNAADFSAGASLTL